MNGDERELPEGCDSVGFSTLLERLGEARGRCPEMHFGQLIATIGLLAEDETGHSLWDVEGAEFAAALERFVADLARRGLDQT